MHKFITIISLLFCNISYADDQQDNALKAILEATYKTYKIDDNINNYIKNIVPFKYKKYAERIAPVIETMSKRKLEYKWNF